MKLLEDYLHMIRLDNILSYLINVTTFGYLSEVIPEDSKVLQLLVYLRDITRLNYMW